MYIREVFRSVQGEGTCIGRPTVFIRFQGCNCRCSWCDTVYAQDKNVGKEMRVGELVVSVVGQANLDDMICITGGEPLIQKEECLKVLHELHLFGYKIILETNGSKSIKEVKELSGDIIISMDVKCPSSGMDKNIKYDNFKFLGKQDVIKFVIKDNKDLYFAKDIITSNVMYGKIVFMPVDGIDIQWLAEEVLKDESLSGIRVLFQFHKYIWPGKNKGV